MIEFVVVDNRKVELDVLGGQLSAVFPKAKVTLFMDPLMSAKYICNNAVDVVLISDIMRPVDGFTLMKVLRIHKPDLPIVMLSESEGCHQAVKLNENQSHMGGKVSHAVSRPSHLLAQILNKV